jgi:hypothetical protein
MTSRLAERPGSSSHMKMCIFWLPGGRSRCNGSMNGTAWATAGGRRIEEEIGLEAVQPQGKMTCQNELGSERS